MVCEPSFNQTSKSIAPMTKDSSDTLATSFHSWATIVVMVNIRPNLAPEFFLADSAGVILAD